MRGLGLDFIKRALVHFCEETQEGRVFLHQRMATSWDTSLDCTHGWTDGRGRHLMHNGVIRSAPESLSVDSQSLMPHLAGGARGLLKHLKAIGEVYANCFIIDSRDHSYGVMRLNNGRLYTDRCGNYSTVAVGPINSKVREMFAVDYPGKLIRKETKPTVTHEEIPDTHYGSFSEVRGYLPSAGETGKQRYSSVEWQERSNLLRDMRELGLLKFYHTGMTNEEIQDIIDEYTDEGPGEPTTDGEFSEDEAEAMIRAAGFRAHTGDSDLSGGYSEYRKALLKEIEKQDKEYMVTEGMTVDELEDIISIPMYRVK